MSLANFIPTGRTSLIKKGTVSLQVQTEYAYRPYPRITTTILNNGQVLHKIEKKLEKPIESYDEQSVMESRMKMQHNDVVGIIKDNDTSGLLKKSHPKSQPDEINGVEQHSTNEKQPEKEIVTPDITGFSEDTKITIADQFRVIDGVKHVYHLNSDGGFINKIESDHFKKAFSGIFKSIGELIEIFSLLPGETITRQKGVYEVERNTLYLISAGKDVFFITLENPDRNINYEQMFKTVVNRIM